MTGLTRLDDAQRNAVFQIGLAATIALLITIPPIAVALLVPRLLVALMATVLTTLPGLLCLLPRLLLLASLLLATLIALILLLVAHSDSPGGPPGR